MPQRSMGFPAARRQAYIPALIPPLIGSAVGRAVCAMPLPSFDPADYPQQLASKVARYKAEFAAFDLPEPEVFASEPQAYRLRAEFRMWHQGDQVGYAMFDPDAPKTPVIIQDFPAAAEPIAQAMPVLRAHLMASPPLKRKIFQVDFLATLSGRLMTTSLCSSRRYTPSPWNLSS